jgi:UTP-glucose-1-phosphate uridylyltransferase
VILQGDAQGAVAGLEEKPSVEEVPSGSGGEIQLADAINIQAQRGKVNAVHSTAMRFDCGSVDGFLAGISHVSNLRHS